MRTAVFWLQHLPGGSLPRLPLLAQGTREAGKGIPAYESLPHQAHVPQTLL